MFSFPCNVHVRKKGFIQIWKCDIRYHLSPYFRSQLLINNLKLHSWIQVEGERERQVISIYYITFSSLNIPFHSFNGNKHVLFGLLYTTMLELWALVFVSLFIVSLFFFTSEVYFCPTTQISAELTKFFAFTILCWCYTSKSNMSILLHVQWKLDIKRSDITKYLI